MGARVYDPSTATFTQPDPIQGGGANAYGYTNGDPVNMTDLSGRSAGFPEPMCGTGLSASAAARRCSRGTGPGLFSALAAAAHGLTSGTVGKVVLVVGVVATCLAPVSDAVCVAGAVGAGITQGGSDRSQTPLGRALGNTGSAYGAASACLGVENARLAIGCGAALYGAAHALTETLSRRH